MATGTGAATTLLACPLCRSHDPKDYIVIGHASQGAGGVQNYPVLRCRRHGVEFADAHAAAHEDDANLKQGLDVMYGAVPAAPDPRSMEIMDAVEDVVGRAGSGSVLHDVGCGNGHLLCEAQRRGWRVQGNDLVAGVAPALEAQDISFRRGPLGEIGYADGCADIVTSICVLPHHLAEPQTDMATVWRMIRPGGYFVLDLPDNGMLRRAVRVLYVMLRPIRPGMAAWLLANIYGAGGHQFAYDRRNISAYLQSLGFEVVTIQPAAPSLQSTLARYAGRPLWFRALAFAAVVILHGIGKLAGIYDHMRVFAKKPAASPS